MVVNPNPVEPSVVRELLPEVIEGARRAGLAVKGAVTVTSAHHGVEGPRITVLVELGASGNPLALHGRTEAPTSVLRLDLSYSVRGGSVVPVAYAMQTAVDSLRVFAANRSGPDLATTTALAGDREPHEYLEDAEYQEAVVALHASTPTEAVRMALAPMVSGGRMTATPPSRRRRGDWARAGAGATVAAVLATGFGAGVGAVVAPGDDDAVDAVASDEPSTTSSSSSTSTSSTSTTTSTSTTAPPAACSVGTAIELLGVDVVAGQYHQGNLLVTVRDAGGTAVDLATVRIRTEKSDGASTTAEAVTNVEGNVIFAMRTTRLGDNTLFVTDVVRDGCTWDPAASTTEFTWQAA